MIPRLTQGPAVLVSRINQVIDTVNALTSFIGDGFIQITRTGGAYTIKLNKDAVVALFPKNRGGGGTAESWATVVTTLSYAENDNVAVYSLRPVSIAEWVSEGTYAVNALAYDPNDEHVYKNTTGTNTATSPKDDAANWTANAASEVTPKLLNEESAETDYRNYAPWLAVGTYVRIIQIGSSWYIDSVFNYLGEDGSVRWNETDWRLASVFGG